MSDSSLVGKWRYNDDSLSQDYINGEFVIRVSTTNIVLHYYRLLATDF